MTTSTELLLLNRYFHTHYDLLINEMTFLLDEVMCLIEEDKIRIKAIERIEFNQNPLTGYVTFMIHLISQGKTIHRIKLEDLTI